MEDTQNTKKSFPIVYNSPVVLSFALISLAVLLIGQITANASNILLFSVYRSSMLSPLFYIRLFGHVLGHSGWSHYIGNMMLFLLIGPMLEEKYGSKDLLFMILITAFVTGIVHIIVSPARLLGASGVVFMMITLSSVTSVKKGKIPLTLIFVVILYIGQQIINGIFVKDNISQLTHIVGGVLGIVFGLVIPNLDDKKPRN